MKLRKFIFFFSFLSLALLPALAHAKATATAMVTQTSRLKFEISRKAIEKDLRDPLKQLSTFSATPAFDAGFFSGITVSGFSKNCLLPKFGLQDGDVVEMINGTPLRFPSDIMEVGEKLSKAKTGSVIRVSLRREEKNITQSYLVID